MMLSRRTRGLSLCAGVAVAVIAAPAPAGVATFSFADIGNSYTGFFFPSNPLIGQRVQVTRITLTLTVEPGSDAALFDTDISFPLVPDAGNVNALSLSGVELGWSGSGTFTYVHETDRFNGVFISTLFGAASFAPGLDGFIHEESRVEMFTVPAPGATGLLGVAGVVAARRRRR